MLGVVSWTLQSRSWPVNRPTWARLNGGRGATGVNGSVPPDTWAVVTAARDPPGDDPSQPLCWDGFIELARHVYE